MPILIPDSSPLKKLEKVQWPWVEQLASPPSTTTPGLKDESLWPCLQGRLRAKGQNWEWND